MALYLGLISGTSVDAIDAALVDLSDDGTGGMRCRLVHARPHGFPPGLRERIEDVITGRVVDAPAIWRIDRDLGEAFADAALSLLDAAGTSAADVEAIGSHGQTVFHAPRDRITVQLGDPNIIAERTGVTTVADLRRRDLAAGGEGAPLAPAFHARAFARDDAPRAVLNLGGIANLSVLPKGGPGHVTGFDTGPANTLLDGWTTTHLGRPFDEDGAWARGGEVLPALLDAMRRDPFFGVPPPKSTGREHFNAAWLAGLLDAHAPGAPPRDVARTLVELTAGTVADALTAHGPSCADVLVCGGGAYNGFTMQRLRALLAPRSVEPTSVAGLDPEWVEAAAFAWLAYRSVRGEAGNAPGATGAGQAVVLGGIYTGRPAERRML